MYNMLGCESFISRSFRPFPRGGEQKIMIVSGVLNSGCERSGGLIRETGRKRLSYGPTIFAKKLQKSREIYNFTAFCGGPNRDRTDDLTDANRTLSQLSYRPICGYFVYFCLIYLCGLLFWQGRCYVALALPTALQAQIPSCCLAYPRQLFHYTKFSGNVKRKMKMFWKEKNYDC